MNAIQLWCPFRLFTPLLLTVPLVASHAKGRPEAERPASPRAPIRTIGVIGGIGPQATMDFEMRLHRVSQQSIDPFFNSGYPSLVVYYHRRPPVVIGEDGLAIQPVRIDLELLQAAARIGPMVDFLVITSNGAHRVAPDIERAAGRPVLSMVDRVVDEVERRKWKRVGLLTLGPPAIYAEPLGRHGIAFETLDEARQKALDRAIFTVMEGREDDATRRVARDALADLRRRGVDGVIVGCTELPFLLDAIDGRRDLINPIQILAEAAVEFATRPGAGAAVTSSRSDGAHD